MKKAAIITGIVFVIIVGSLIAIPVLFKDTLLEKTKLTIKKQMGVEVGFNDFKLSLIKNFPKASLQLTDVFVKGSGNFSHDSIFTVSDFRAVMSLASLFKKSGATIEKITMEKPVLNLLVAEDGSAIWDFSTGAGSPDPATETATSTDDKVFQLGLENVEISDALIIYDDRSIDTKLLFRNSDLKLSGKMYGSTTTLDAWAKVGEFVLTYDSVDYVSGTTLETNTLFSVDYTTLDFAIKENKLLVNRLPLVVGGGFKMPNDTIFFNLDIKSEKSDLDEFLALVPKDYEKYLDGLTATGNASLAGFMKGYYYEDEYPWYQFAINVENGRLKYKALPEEVRNITADVRLIQPQGDLDKMEFRISKAHAEIKNNPIDLTLLVNDLFGDPYFDGGLVGKINFTELKDALPLDSVNIAGEVDANVFVKARLSDIMEENYSEVKSDGIVFLSGFSYNDPKLTKPVFIPNGKLNFSPSFAELTELEIHIGQSDINLSGKVSNYLGYYLTGGKLTGNLDLTSQNLNLNELMNIQVKTETPPQEKTKPEPGQESEPALTVFSIPENLDLRFTSHVSKAKIGSFPATDVNGLVTASKGKLVLDGLNMNLFGGQIELTGSYLNNPENKPFFDFGFDVKEIGLPEAARSVKALGKIMPANSKSQGKISTRFTVKGRLDKTLMPIASSVNGLGSLSTKNIQIIDSPTFDQLKSVLQQDRLKNIRVDDFTGQFNVANGNLMLKPFATKIAGQQVTITGQLNVDDILDAKMDFVVERSAFGPKIQEILGILPGQENITAVPVTVMLSGPVGKPEVKMDYTETRKYVTDKVKKSASESLKKSIDKIGQGLKKLIEK